MQDENGQPDIPASAAAAVAGHTTDPDSPLAEQSHTAMHSHVDDTAVAQVADRFGDAPRDAGARQPGEQ